MSRLLALLQATGDTGVCVAASILAVHYLWLQMETRR